MLQAREKAPGAVEATVDGFLIFNGDEKMRRVPEDWKFPHCPQAAGGCELWNCGNDKVRGVSPIKMLEKSDVDYLNKTRQAESS